MNRERPSCTAWDMPPTVPGRSTGAMGYSARLAQKDCEKRLVILAQRNSNRVLALSMVAGVGSEESADTLATHLEKKTL